MSHAKLSSKLDRPVNNDYDHVLGPANADNAGRVRNTHVRLPYANERMRRFVISSATVFVMSIPALPSIGSDIALRAAELVEHAKTPKAFGMPTSR